MILLDTCALIWWTVDPSQLSVAAAAECGRAKPQEILISAISIWEIGIKIKKGKLDIGATINEYLARLRQVNAIKIIPVDEDIFVENLNLKWAHRDPADRTIVATAQRFGVPIVTADHEILKFCPTAIW